VGTIKVYVLVEQIEACFQLMEIRAALGPHFVGFNTGRWDYINSVSDAITWDRRSSIRHRRHHDDLRLHAHLRGPRAPRREHADAKGQYALWQAAWSWQPVGSEAGVTSAMKRAAGGERTAKAPAGGSPWKMVHIVRPVWEKVGENQLGRDSRRSPTAEMLTA
jgi:malate synthase